MFYVPDLENYKCVYMYSSNTLRAYKQQPAINSTSEYVDYYVDNHYLYREGTQSWGNYYNNLPSCLDSSKLTNNWYYRTDLADIAIIIFIFLFIFYWVLFKFLDKILRV